MLILTLSTTAQEVIPKAENTGFPALITDPMTFLILLMMVILLSTILVMARTIKLLIWQIAGAPKPVETEKTEKPAVQKVGFWTRMNEKLNDAKPVEQEADILLDHDYDGIKELDNNLPPWWKYGFYLTIIFAFIYMAHYHLAGSGNVGLDEFNEQLAEAKIEKAERLKNAASNVDETSATVMTGESDIAKGKKTYDEKCLVCHGKSGEGLVGPNLTDEYWIHGGSIKDIFKTIKYGFPSKGMLAWQDQLTPVQIQEVASFIKSIKGTNPPNPKDPQGDLYKEGGTDAPTTSTDSTAVAIATDSTSTSVN